MKQFKKTRHGTKVGGMGILTSALCFAWTGNPAWLALLLAIVLIALCFHEAAARLGGRSRRRGSVSRTAAKSRPLKKLPRLAISERTPLAHPIKLDGHTIDLTAPTARNASRTQRSTAAAARGRVNGGRRQAGQPGKRRKERPFGQSGECGE